MEYNVRSGGEGSGKQSKKEIWKACWNLQSPNVVKMFLWRALNNLLPTRHNLRCRGINLVSVCPICESEEEDILHVLWKCPAAVDVWGCGKLKFQKMSVDGLNFIGLFEELVERCDISDLTTFAVTARLLWLRRNAVIHGETFTHPNQIIRQVESILEEFQKANEGRQHETQQPRILDPIIWQPPPVNIVKINWDAAVDLKNGRIGLGCIARNSDGVFLAGRSITKEATVDPTTAEAIAAIYAVIFGKEQGYRQIVFEGDALRVVQAINDTYSRQSCFGHFVEGIKMELQSLEQGVFTHVAREANGDAHVLAKLATNHIIDSTWVEVPPLGICGVFRRGV
jgi:ribonuclease HI